jgi:predicted O-methyltransferase YrrM
VKILIGPATTTLLNLESDASFDLAFIDADKQSNVEYFVQAKRLVRNGGVIIVDNVVRNGRVADPEQSDPSIEGVRKLLEYIHKDPTLEATTLGTVGEKGYDGFLYAINKSSFN